MRLAIVTLLLGLAFAGTAQAEDYIDIYPCMDPCCVFSAICVDIECCGTCWDTAPMTVQFLDADDNVLGSGVIDDYCDDCYDQQFADLDNMVNSMDVCKIRLITDLDPCCTPEWASIKVMCEDPCDCPDWKKAWKGDLWCWEPMPEMIVEVPEQVITPPRETPQVAQRPEPERPVMREPEPEPEPMPEPEPEVVQVIGNG